jgi:hypothetical protein
MPRLLAACLVALAPAFICAQAPADDKPASIEGTVTNSLTGEPLVRAHVALRGSGSNARSYGALTTAEGKFSVTSVAPGTYQASAERAGFFAPSGTDGRTTVEIVLRGGDKKDNLKLKLAPLGAITGRVLDADGGPMESIQVSAADGSRDFFFSAITDDKGEFRLGGLRPGRYRVLARPPSIMQMPPEVRSDGTVEVRYVQTYYPNAIETKYAARVVVTAGVTVGEVEIRLASIPMVRISGRVLGMPKDAQNVVLQFRQGAGSGFSGMRVNADGTFLIWNVNPGKYRLSASTASGAQVTQTAPVEIEVGQSHIDNIVLQTVTPSDIAGQLMFEDEQARPPSAPDQQAPPRLELREPGGATSARADIGADGSFRLTRVQPGLYRATPTWPSVYVKSMELGTTAMDGSLLDLSNGSGGAPLTVLLSSATGEVSGVVKGESDPLAGARVMLVAEDPDAGFRPATITSGPDGSYGFAGLWPGKYKLAVVDANDYFAINGDLDEYEEALVRIEIHPKDKLTQNLKGHATTR